MEFPKRVIAIRFTDKYFQAGYFDQTSAMEIEKGKDLYISFSERKIDYFDEAFINENSICMMQSEEKLNQQLDKLKMDAIYIRITYTIPNAQELWCVFLKKIFDETIKKCQKYKIQVCGIVLSLPDEIDFTLKNMIMNAIEAIKFNDKRNKIDMKYKVINNSNSAAAAYMRCIAAVKEICKQNVIV